MSKSPIWYVRCTRLVVFWLLVLLALAAWGFPAQIAHAQSPDATKTDELGHLPVSRVNVR